MPIVTTFRFTKRATVYLSNLSAINQSFMPTIGATLEQANHSARCKTNQSTKRKSEHSTEFTAQFAAIDEPVAAAK